VQSPAIRGAAADSLAAERSFAFRTGEYHVRMAVSEADRIAAFRLRFLVFNLELNEGLCYAWW